MTAGAEEGIHPARQVSCPDIAKAKETSPLDEYDLARAYDKGQCGVVADGKTAKKWYLTAAKHGYAPAQYQLGEKYFTGGGGVPDYPRAKRWYLAAARQGHGLAQLRLGFLYAEAHFAGLKPDSIEAEKWFLKAAEQNAGDAQFRLGNFYHNYKNPPDPDKAVFWLTKAAEGGHRVAMYDLSRIIKDEKPEQALSWLTKAAELDLLPAQMSLSEMYAAGNGVARDPVQSLAWTLRIAAKPTAAPFWIDKAGDILFEGGDNISRDYAAALRFYERAAAKDDPHALARLGRMHLQGLGVAVDKIKAMKYLQKAAASGSDEAKEILAKEILKGQADDNAPEE
ncbi:MAG: sel1 repeat family protein [Alphaproteobacteria bacterium]|nr:sel1 repeat family protein [Alphaproteobacteria bacterium]